MDDAIFDSSQAHQNQQMQLLTDADRLARFSRIVLDLLQNEA